jgi:glucosamine--fructose-6-phosphate aminotransferase (isomerizing)
MCGILGCIGVEDAAQVLHDGLKRLEYRGYDSAGIAVAHEGDIQVDKTAGRVEAIEPTHIPHATFGLAHTRWATHGEPNEANAHPHTDCAGRIAIAHNGIIENHDELRQQLRQDGHAFTSTTDTEVIAHLIEDAYQATGDLGQALRQARHRLEGSYAILAVHADEPNLVVGTRHESPLVVGIDDGALYLASDVVAFREHTDRVVHLEDGDLVRLTSQGLIVDGQRTEPVQAEQVAWDLEDATKAGFPHFMLKEMHEQPRALREALTGRTQPGSIELNDGDTSTRSPSNETARDRGIDLAQVADHDQLIFIACGSSYNAALAAAHKFEQLAGIEARVERASEYEPNPWQTDRAAVVAVTQSGETADTLRALEAAKQAGFTTLAVTNTNGSTATRTAHGWVPIRAGPEISVAATKTFASQLAVLHNLAAHLAHLRGFTPDPRVREELDHLQDVPTQVQATLDEAGPANAVGQRLADHDRCFVLGSGANHPLAEEIALKIKEISYVHAEAFPAGELKHGPLALVEEGTPVLALTPRTAEDPEAMISSMSEVAARGADVIAITDEPQPIEERGFQTVPVASKTAAGFVYSALVQGQRIAYQCAVERGCNVDKPRNLAKSVTVE